MGSRSFASRARRQPSRPGRTRWRPRSTPRSTDTWGTPLGYSGDGASEIGALALRAFGYGWKYREAPFGEAAYVDQAGQSVRLAGDWIVPIKPALSRWRDMGQLLG